VPNENPETGFVLKPLGNVEPPGAAVADVTVDEDEAEKLKSEEGCVTGALVLVELVVKKPGLAYAAELLKAVGDVDDDGETTALLGVATVCNSHTAQQNITMIHVLTKQLAYRSVSGHHVLFEVSVRIGMLDVGYSVRSSVNADLLL